MKRFLLFSILMLIASSSFSTVPSSECLKYYWEGPLPVGSENPYFMNEDSVMIDSCENSETYLHLFVDGPYQISFDYNIIPKQGIYPADTVILYTIDDIDPKYSDVIKDFKKFESDYGSFKFQEIAPDRADTTAFIGRSLFLNFDSVQEIETIVLFLKEIESVKFARSLAKHGFVTSINSEKIKNLKIYPNPAKEEINISLDELINTIQILDINGKVLISKLKLTPGTEQSLNIDFLQSGTYLIRINDNLYQKFIKD